MTAEEWQRARGILALALERPFTERQRLVAEECADSAVLRSQVEALLAEYDGSTDLDIYIEQRQRADVPSGVVRLAADPSIERTRTVDLASLSDPAAYLFPGAPRWAEFVLLDKVGQGGFGVVYRAWDAALKRQIALKIIDARALPHADDDAVLREGQMLARVRHPNVVTVYRAERVGTQVGLAMEFIEGKTLSDLVATTGPLSAQEAALIGSALCDALAAIHRVGLVHRDVKASNVIRENGGRIVLMDFGAGREWQEETGARLLGTPVYMPPEVLRGGALTPATDIYSLGVLLFYLVSGRYPVDGAGFHTVLLNHDRGERLSLGDVRHDLPDAFVSLIERVTDHDVHRRPRSVGVLKRELLDTVAISARQPAEPRPTARSGGRNRPVPRSRSRELTQRAGLGLVGVLSLLVALGFLTTLEFNSVLGRTGAFGTESPLALVRWGANSLLAPAIYVALLVLVFNVAMFVTRFAARLVPPLQRAADWLRRAALKWSAWIEQEDPNDLLRGVSVLGLVALLLILWNFAPLLKAFVLQINRAPSSDLAVLGLGNNTTTFLYRRLLEIDLMLLCIWTAAVLRLHAKKGVRVAPMAGASTVAVIGLILVFLVGPWRLMFHSKFPQASFAGESCFVVATHGEDVLLHCPHAAPPRNRIVRANDPALKPSGPIAPLFDAHEAVVGGTPR